MEEDMFSASENTLISQSLQKPGNVEADLRLILFTRFDGFMGSIFD